MRLSFLETDEKNRKRGRERVAARSEKDRCWPSTKEENWSTLSASVSLFT